MSTAERRYEILLAEEAERARARTVFAFGMVGGLGLTLAGNLAAPLVSASVPLALVTFSLPPLLAGWGAHLALTVHRAAPRTNAGKRAARGAVALAITLFGIALIASYTHLRDLFITGGYADWLASIFAAAIDLALLTATAAWFSMRPTSDAELRAARAEIEAEEAAELRAREDAERAKAHAERAQLEAAEQAKRDHEAELERARLNAELELERARLNAEAERERARQAEVERARADAQRVLEHPRPHAVESTVDSRFLELAAAAHRAEIARRTPVEKVAAALAKLEEGGTNGAIERSTGTHRDTVQKLREWVESAPLTAAS
ncbi:Protein of uncharacterised function (DUF2637) [Mycobacteroides abscessus]|uniref:hypothetical protein n=1 Tax=Mycobacteroides abscessus TaxID=36809 RepID=UPI0005E06A2F|nr:hypothetical protein [Mycobacteroides abscessus]CPX20621.1 Protein of uncharacterised function (DUF2637) [Mycobacteroides abscessus]CRG61228.1 Protein of uncharacterised function (DUF2637) [Mycobacteroides abscessus]